MRVLHIIPTVHPSYGGPLFGMNDISVQMATTGWDFEVITLDAPNAPCLSANLIPATGVGPGLSSIGYTRSLDRWIKDNAHRFDVAVVHGVWTYASVGGGRSCKAAGLPYVIFTHGMLDPYFREIKPVKHWIKQIFWLWQGGVLRDAYRVVFTARQEAELARGAFIGPHYREHILTFGASAPPVEGRKARAEEARAAIDELGAAPYILFLSRIHPKKGADILIKAFANVVEKHDEFHLVVAGPDPDNLIPTLQSLAAARGMRGRVHFPGPIYGDMKWGMFEGADVFVLPTHQENFGVVLAEALACGVPVLTTNKTNICRELSQTGGAMICEDTVDGVSDILEIYLGLPCDEKVEMRVKARIGYEQIFTNEAAARDLQDILTKAFEDQL